MRVALFISFATAAIIYSLIRGGAPERAAAAICATSFAVDPVAHVFFPPTYVKVDHVHFAIDITVWVAFVALALNARRFWPLCVASLQSLVMTAHLTRMLDVSIHPVAYGIMQVASYYPLLLILAIGTFLHQRRLRSNGSDPSWRSSSPWSHPSMRMR